MKNKSIWQLLLLGTTEIVLLCALDALLEPDKLAYFFVVMPAGALFLLAMLVVAAISSKRRRDVPAALAMLALYGLISFAFLKHQFVIRNAERWLLFSRHYKAEVLKQPEPQGQELKHVNWDGWGFAGVGDTTAYLISGHTVRCSKSGSPGKALVRSSVLHR